MLCHLAALALFVFPAFGNILGPLIVWLLKKDQYPLVDDQGKESLNFQITVTIAIFILAAITAVLIIVLVGFLLIPVLIVIGLAEIILPIVAALQANQGVPYRYPFNIRFIK